MNKPGQPDPRDQQDHGQDPADHCLGGLNLASEEKNPDVPERFAESVKSSVCLPLSQVQHEAADQPDQDHGPDHPADLISIPAGQ